MDSRGAVVVSQKTLAEMLGVHRNTVGKSIKVLEDGNWIESVQLGGQAGGVRCYLVNRRVAWADRRDRGHYAAFDARIIVNADEQLEPVGNKKPDLIQLPRIGEYQLPRGDVPPPTQTTLPDLEPDLPALPDE